MPSKQKSRTHPPRRRILAVTGSRSEYGLMRPVLKALLRDPDVALRIVACGMHLSLKHGETVREIEADGFQVFHRIPLDPQGDTPFKVAQEVGRGIQRFSDVFLKEKPDILLVVGDRPEVFAAVGAASFMNIVVAHVHGGDRTRGGTDESTRHAVTKMSHMHFPGTAISRRRLVRLGENPHHIYRTGSPAVDEIREMVNIPFLALQKMLGEDFGKDFGYAVFLFHPISTRPEEAGKQAEEILMALKRIPLSVVCLYPNNDPGARNIIKAICDFSRECGDSRVFQTLPRSCYLALLKNARVLVGNSSSGIIDAASFRLPVVNVGSRQDGRERSCNVVDAEPKAISVQKALSQVLTDSRWRRGLRRCRNVYGDGRAGERIARQLATVRLSPDLLQKQITY